MSSSTNNQDQPDSRGAPPCREDDDDGVAVVVVDREQLRQLKRLLASLPDRDDEPSVEEPSSIPWAARKANQEMQAIEEALQKSNGNVTRAAELLGMHRTTLWRKLKRYRGGK